MGEDDFFPNLDDLDDIEDLEETPDFDLTEDEPFLGFDEEDEGGGVSRTFRIVGALMLVGAIAIIILLIVFALGGGDELTDNEKTSTAIVATNTKVAFNYNLTLTAIMVAQEASQTALFNFEQTSTASHLTAVAQQTEAAIAAAQTATAEFEAAQTLSAAQTATQMALDLTATAEYEANILSGVVNDEEGRIFGGVMLRLYRDDGDGEFDPSEPVVPPTPVPTTDTTVIGIVTAIPSGGIGEPPAPAPSAPSEALPINYGETVQGTLAVAAPALWTFTGTAGDSVVISTVASDPVQMDMFVELLDASDTLLIGDDDSGGDTNAAITDYELPTDGSYTIRVSSVAGPGAYTLSLSRSVTGDVELEPTQEGISGAVSGGKPLAVAVDGDRVPARAQGTPQPGGDELVDTTTTELDGTFDFGSLEPGVYWLELDYASLPPELQAVVPAGERIVVRVDVPVQGQFLFSVLGPTPTPQGPSPIDLTSTARAARASDTPMPTGMVDTLTPGPSATLEPITETLVGTGFFSDISDKTGGVEGSNGLAILAIAAVGLVAVVFIARRLRTSS